MDLTRQVLPMSISSTGRESCSQVKSVDRFLKSFLVLVLLMFYSLQKSYFGFVKADTHFALMD